MRWLGICFLSLVSLVATASEEFRPKLEEARLVYTFAPIGFDSNDRVQLVVSGVFNNTCYQLGPHHARVEGNNILVDQKAYRYDGLCLQVTVPFHQVVELDELLDKGDYNIVDQNSGEKLGVLPVETAQTGAAGPGPDNHSYAPVSDAFIVKDGATGKDAVVLRGTFSNDCMHFENVKTLPYDNQVVVLPIVSKEKRNDCQEGRYPFEQRELLPSVKTKTYLLHVRSMNGQGINKIVDGLTN